MRFHVRFAAYRRRDLLYLRFGVRQESFSIFFFHPIADAIWCRCNLVSAVPYPFCRRAANRTANRNLISHAMCKRWQFRVGHQIVDTPNCICDLQQIGHEIAHEISPLGVDYTVRFRCAFLCPTNRLTHRHVTLVGKPLR
jgi:hypothetical protein